MASLEEIDKIAAQIRRMQQNGMTWEAIADQFRDLHLNVTMCQALARGEQIAAELLTTGSQNRPEGPSILLRNEMNKQGGIIIWVHSYGVARTGKTTLARELAAFVGLGYHAKVALVDADIVGAGLYFSTLPTDASQVGMGLAAWQAGTSPEEAEKHAWAVPGTQKMFTDPVIVWSMPPGIQVPDLAEQEAWSVNFWRFARATYSLIVVDTGEVVPRWAEVARVFADQELVVVPQDPLAIHRMGLAARGQHGRNAGAVVMGYAEKVVADLTPARIAAALGIPLIAALPYDPVFANWAITRSVPYFPAQQKLNESVATAMQRLVPETFQATVSGPVKRGRWRR